jgi:sulfatase modifying factor 1
VLEDDFEDLVKESMRAHAIVLVLLLGGGCGGEDKKATNAACGGDGECASAICFQGTCLASTPLSVGESCENNAQCSTVNCDAGTCQKANTEDGAACGRDQQCLSGVCASDKHCAKVGVCGDRKREGSEQCDGVDLGEKRCGDVGFDAGDLACDDKTCQFDTSGCVRHQWVRIEAGTFRMGSATSDPDHAANETQHEVTLTRPFEISAYEVTQSQFKRVQRWQPANFKDESRCKAGDCPVENVRWSEAAAYCNALSEQKGLEPCYSCTSLTRTIDCNPSTGRKQDIASCPGYRLPTEAEWEYAYRAGSQESYYGGFSADKIAWTQENSDAAPRPVGQKQPNAWGLYDMAGNVWEWCHDWYTDDLGSSAVTDPSGPAFGDSRVTRGGSWHFEAHRARAALRLFSRPDQRLYDTGFRCVRTLF